MNGRGILNAFGCMFALTFALQFLATARVHQGLSWRPIQQMMRVSSRGPKVLLLVGALIGLGSALLEPELSNWIPPFPRVFVAGISLMALNGACLPPTFLFLAASQTKGFSLASEMQRIVSPLKLVHLLNSLEAGAIVGEALHHNEYRVTADWQHAVRSVSKISPVIIVDVRELTQHIYTEIVHLGEDGLDDRTFIVAENAQIPDQLERFFIRSEFKFCILTPELFKTAVSGVGWIVLFKRIDNFCRFLEFRIRTSADRF